MTRERRGDETEKMATMNRWLDGVCAELGVDRGVLDANTPALLRLVGEVAHGPSRPGAPLTAFLVGLGAAQARGGGTPGPADPAATSSAVAERIEAVRELVARWDGGAQA